MKRGLAAAVTMVVVSLAGPASAYTLDWLGCKLPNSLGYDDGGGDPFAYYVDQTEEASGIGTMLPGGLLAEDVVGDVQHAFDTWSSVGCAYIGAVMVGTITDPSQLGPPTNGQSVIGSFVVSDSDPRYTDDLGGGAAIGVALLYTIDGVIQACDVLYNAAGWPYSDDGSPTAIDFPSVAQHETGHCFGLAHAPEDPNSVMYPTITEGTERRTPDARDINNLCQLYPLAGSLGSPCSGASCGNSLFCIPDPVAGGNFCSQPCDVEITTPNADGGCAVGFGCKASTEIAGESGACFPGVGDEAQVGGPCMYDTDCVGTAAVCVLAAGSLTYPDGYCSEQCAGNACPNGNTCVEIGIDDGGDPEDYCLTNCNAVTGGCRDDGYICDPITADGTGFCYPACESDADCGGQACLCDGICVGVGNPTSAIGDPCQGNGDCPTGAFCIPSSEGETSTGWTGGYCAESCGGTEACIVCPNDSACVIDGEEGQAYCLQLCSANGGCRSGYGCASELTPTGMAEVCEPGLGSACIDDNGCEVGEVCLNGTCVEPGGDGGCEGALCPKSDGGIGVTNLGGSPDAGVVTPKLTGGCGCGSSGAELGGWAVLAAVVRRRRSTW